MFFVCYEIVKERKTCYLFFLENQKLVIGVTLQRVGYVCWTPEPPFSFGG